MGPGTIGGLIKLWDFRETSIEKQAFQPIFGQKSGILKRFSIETSGLLYLQKNENYYWTYFHSNSQALKPHQWMQGCAF